MLPTTVPALIAPVTIPSDSPLFPSLAMESARDCRTGMTRCSPSAQTTINATAHAHRTGTSNSIAAMREQAVPKRRTFQSENRWSAAKIATSSTPGVSRRNSSTPRSKPLMSYVSTRKLLNAAPKHPMPTPHTRMLVKKAPAPVPGRQTAWYEESGLVISSSSLMPHAKRMEHQPSTSCRSKPAGTCALECATHTAATFECASSHRATRSSTARDLLPERLQHGSSRSSRRVI